MGAIYDKREQWVRNIKLAQIVLKQVLYMTLYNADEKLIRDKIADVVRALAPMCGLVVTPMKFTVVEYDGTAGATKSLRRASGDA